MSTAWIAFWCGTVVGCFAALVVLALCKAAGDADRRMPTPAEDISADDVYGMLSSAGDGGISKGSK